jgi:hypothetical protein
MNGAATALLQRDPEFTTPVIECGVEGPHRQQGFLLRAERLETLVWDLESEIASPRKRGMTGERPGGSRPATWIR